MSVPSRLIRQSIIQFRFRRFSALLRLLRVEYWYFPELKGAVRSSLHDYRVCSRDFYTLLFKNSISIAVDAHLLSHIFIYIYIYMCPDHGHLFRHLGFSRHCNLFSFDSISPVVLEIRTDACDVGPKAVPRNSSQVMEKIGRGFPRGSGRGQPACGPSHPKQCWRYVPVRSATQRKREQQNAEYFRHPESESAQSR
jgi:hypothetical protein